jgi:hypothetical protein
MPVGAILWCHFNYNLQICFHFLLGPQVSIHGFVYVLNLIEMLAQVNGGEGTLSHGHSTIQSTTMELKLNSHVVPWPSLIRVQLIDLNGIGWKTIGRCGGDICVQYIDRLVPQQPRMVLQLTWALSATFAYTICAIVKSIWFCAIIGFLVIAMCTSNMCAFICSY